MNVWKQRFTHKSAIRRVAERRVGKTTLATALAVQATVEGKRALVFDLDPQASASFDDAIAITATRAARLSHMLAAVREAGCDLVIVDKPPFSKDIAFEATSIRA